MKALMLMVLHRKGSAFVVDIEEDKTVADLQNLIKATVPSVVKDDDADSLRLIVAKKGGNWLKSSDADFKWLEDGVVLQDITRIKRDGLKMDPTQRMDDPAFNFPDEDDAGEDEIHVLVDALGRHETKPHPLRQKRWNDLNILLDRYKKEPKRDAEKTSEDDDESSSSGYSSG